MRKHMGIADWSKATQLSVSWESSAGTKAMVNSRSVELYRKEPVDKGELR